MKFDSRSADAVRHVDFVVNKPGIPNVAPLSPRLKHRLVGVGAAAMLAFAVGLLVAIFGARAADAPAKPQHAAERAATDSARVQPKAVRAAQSARRQRQPRQVRGRALSPAHRSGAGDLVGFRLEYSSSGSTKR